MPLQEHEQDHEMEHDQDDSCRVVEEEVDMSRVSIALCVLELAH
jgi:hypothetical protein